VLVERGLVEQRYQAVLEVLAGVSVIEVAGRFGVTRQTVHRWMRRYAAQGLAGLVDGSTAPGSCPHQMPPAVEARIVELRREHSGWGPRTIGHRLARDGVVPLPARSSIYRCLVRHRLIEVQPRRKTRADYKRWEGTRAMELWQMDIVGGVSSRMGGKRASSPVSITTHGSVSRRMWCGARPRVRCATRWARRCARMVCRKRS